MKPGWFGERGQEWSAPYPTDGRVEDGLVVNEAAVVYLLHSRVPDLRSTFRGVDSSGPQQPG